MLSLQNSDRQQAQGTENQHGAKQVKAEKAAVKAQVTDRKYL